MDSEFISKRTEAISWWNLLSPEQKIEICKKHEDLVFGWERWPSLTGREIQLLKEKSDSIV